MPHAPLLSLSPLSDMRGGVAGSSSLEDTSGKLGFPMKIAAVVSQTKPTEQIHPETGTGPPRSLVSSDQAKEKKLSLEDEKKCGRPLGVKWRGGKLYILDAYHGLFELDVANGVHVGKHLVRTFVLLLLEHLDRASLPNGRTTRGAKPLRSTKIELLETRV